MNVFTASGNIGRDAEVRNAGGTSVAGFSCYWRAWNARARR